MKRDEGRERRITRAAAELAKLGGTRKEAAAAKGFSHPRQPAMKRAPSSLIIIIIIIIIIISELMLCASQARISMPKRVSRTASRLSRWPQQNKPDSGSSSKFLPRRA
jgi:hypothetical protein